jgi:hypothetical protein
MLTSILNQVAKPIFSKKIKDMEKIVDSLGLLRWPKTLSSEAVLFLRHVLRDKKWTTLPAMYHAMELKYKMHIEPKGDLRYLPPDKMHYMVELRTIAIMAGFEPGDIYYVQGKVVQVYFRKGVTAEGLPIQFFREKKHKRPPKIVRNYADPIDKKPVGRPPKDGIYREIAHQNFINAIRGAMGTHEDEESEI